MSLQKLTLVLVLSLCALLATAQSVPDPALTVAISAAERSALAAYLEGRNQDAVGWFKQVISLYERELAQTKAGEPTHLAIRYDLLLAHGRLAVVHGRRDEGSERDKHLERALAYGKECMRPPLSSVKDVLPLIASVDRNHAKR